MLNIDQALSTSAGKSSKGITDAVITIRSERDASKDQIARLEGDLKIAQEYIPLSDQLMAERDKLTEVVKACEVALDQLRHDFDTIYQGGRISSGAGESYAVCCSHQSIAKRSMVQIGSTLALIHTLQSGGGK
jgi:hypothetical protein